MKPDPVNSDFDNKTAELLEKIDQCVACIDCIKLISNLTEWDEFSSIDFRLQNLLLAHYKRQLNEQISHLNPEELWNYYVNS